MPKELVFVKFDRKGRLKEGKKGEVEFDIYLTRDCRKRIHVTSLTLAEWATYQHSKEFLAEKLRIEGICRAMIVLNEELTLENLNKHLGIEPKKEKVKMSEEEFERHRLISSKTSFLDFFEMESKKNEYAASTLRRKKVMLDALKEFGKIKRFEDLTVNNIKKFDEWLDNGRERTTITNYHKQVHMYILRAKKQKFITEDPYESCEFEKGKNKKRVPLSENELLKLINHKFEGNVEIVRDLFIFSAYTGLAYCDVMNFKYSKMIEQIESQVFIDGSRIKTGSDFFTPILPHAMDVLKKYNYRLPFFTDQFINRTLKKIKEECGIKKKITFHIARHSFATLAINNDVPVSHLQKMLGHKKIETTMIYAKVMPRTIYRHATALTEKLK